MWALQRLFDGVPEHSQQLHFTLAERYTINKRWVLSAHDARAFVLGRLVLAHCSSLWTNSFLGCRYTPSAACFGQPFRGFRLTLPSSRLRRCRRLQSLRRRALAASHARTPAHCTAACSGQTLRAQSRMAAMKGLTRRAAMGGLCWSEESWSGHERPWMIGGGRCRRERPFAVLLRPRAEKHVGHPHRRPEPTRARPRRRPSPIRQDPDEPRR